MATPLPRDGVDRIDAERLDNRRDISDLGRHPLQGETGTGIFLMPGHAGNPVVHDHAHGIAAIVGYMQQAGHAGMEEGRIADHRYHFRRIAKSVANFLDPMPHTDAGAHANTGVFGVERHIAAKRIATDIAGDHQVFDFAQFIEEAAVRATGAQQRWPGNHLGRIRLDQRDGFAFQRFGNDIRRQFADSRHFCLADTGDPCCLQLFFNERFQFFHNIKRFHRSGEIADLVDRQRINAGRFQL